MNPKEPTVADGLALHQANRLEEAGAVYRQVLAKNPNEPDALHLMGVFEGQKNRLRSAEDLIRRAIAIRPHPDYFDNLGTIYGKMNRFEDAIAVARHAVALDPRSHLAAYNLGNLLVHVGNMPEAVNAFRLAVAARPDFAGAIQNLGTSLHRVGQFDEAELMLRRAVALAPNYPEAYNNLGVLLTSRMKIDEAIAAYETAIRLKPDLTAAMTNLGGVLRMRGRYADAIMVLREAIRLNPTAPEAKNNLGITLREMGRLEEAILVFRQALELRPNMFDTLSNLGNAYKDCGNVEDAVAHFGRALSIRPIESGVHSNLVYTLEFHPGYDDASLAREQRRWNDLHALPLQQFIRPHDNDRSPDRHLRIGYVSAYFFSQAEAFFVLPLLENHDRDKFEIFGYSSSAKHDEITDRHQKAVEHWRLVGGEKPEDLAEQIRRDKIDVLVDLAMHMAHNRLLVFAQKPAPVQVAWIAYPGATGLDAMDYRLTDRFIDPVEAPTSVYREQSIRLPDCWCCYSPLGEIRQPKVREPGPIKFGSLNNPCKLNEPLLRLWARVLHATPATRLLLMALSEDHRLKLRQLFRALGIGDDRLEFVGRRQRDDYMDLYCGIDICLDPLPYNGITTTCDSLWMGVPVLTLVGKTAAGRAGKSILSTVGVPELVTQTEDEFVQRAFELANDLPRLAEYRTTLRQKMRISPVCDQKRFARNMEAAYRSMWQTWAREGQ